MQTPPGTITDEHGRPLDQIRLVGIEQNGFHGVLDFERVEGQPFIADVTIHLDTRRAAASDDLSLTINYGTVAEQIAQVLTGQPVNLIETVAEQIAALVLDYAAVGAVDVFLHKPRAPIPVQFDDVVVAIRRDRIKLPAARFEAPAPAARTGPEELSAAGGTEARTSPRPSPEAPSSTAPAPKPLTAEFPEVPLQTLVPGEGAGGAAATWVPETGVVPGLAEGLPRRDGHSGGPDLPEAAASGGTNEEHPVPQPDRMDVSPPGPVRVVLGLGSNLGEARRTLRAAVGDLAEAGDLEILAVAPLARTAAVGGPEQNDFLNTVVLVRTALAPRALMKLCQSIEATHDRVREERWGPRTLDIDLINYDDLVAGSDDLELPHPRAHERAFVLEPWSQIEPDANLPGLGGGPVGALAATAPDRSGVRWLALNWLEETSSSQAQGPPAPAPGPEQ